MRAADVVPLVAPPTTKIGYPVLIGTAAPANPVQGMAWLDTTNPPGQLKIYNNGAWTLPAAAAVTGAFLPLAGGTLNPGATVDFNNGFVLNADYDQGRF